MVYLPLLLRGQTCRLPLTLPKFHLCYNTHYETSFCMQNQVEFDCNRTHNDTLHLQVGLEVLFHFIAEATSNTPSDKCVLGLYVTWDQLVHVRGEFKKF